MANAFISGALMMGLAVAGCFFLRFYRDTGDRLFLFFAIAFLVLAASRVALACAAAPDEVRPSFYLLRLLAFAMILVAIVDKNRAERRAPSYRPPGGGREAAVPPPVPADHA
jgi:uncharacterized membrane protein YoaK (UPF0700 family)